MKGDYLIMNGEKTNFFPTIAKTQVPGIQNKKNIIKTDIVIFSIIKH